MSKGGLKVKYREHVGREGDRPGGVVRGGGGTTGALEWRRGWIPPASPLAQNWRRGLDQAGDSMNGSDVSEMTDRSPKDPRPT